jgi:hypothetical protein
MSEMAILRPKAERKELAQDALRLVSPLTSQSVEALKLRDEKSVAAQVEPNVEINLPVNFRHRDSRNPDSDRSFDHGVLRNFDQTISIFGLKQRGR